MISLSKNNNIYMHNVSMKFSDSLMFLCNDININVVSACLCIHSNLSLIHSSKLRTPLSTGHQWLAVNKLPIQKSMNKICKFFHVLLWEFDCGVEEIVEIRRQLVHLLLVLHRTCCQAASLLASSVCPLVLLELND